MATHSICSKNIGPRALNTPNRIRKKRWHGKRVKSFDQRPWRQKNSKHGKNVVLACCTYGFFKRCLVLTTTSSVLSVTGVLAPHFTYSHRLLSFSENHTLDKRCLNFCPDHTFFEHWMRKRGKLSSLCCTMHHRASTESYYAARQKKRSRWKKSWVDCFAWVVVGGFSAPNLAAYVTLSAQADTRAGGHDPLTWHWPHLGADLGPRRSPRTLGFRQTTISPYELRVSLPLASPQLQKFHRTPHTTHTRLEFELVEVVSSITLLCLY